MQFVTNGPDIPDALIQAHEDGRVIFFCGAGISYPAGLPGFDGLVERIYEKLGEPKSTIETDAFERGQYDATLDLLERRVAGQRIAVRKALAGALQPKLDAYGATDTHRALLQLARFRDGGVRLVTTNFDRIFEHVAECDGISTSAYAAPMLPIPKNSRWNGVVYLHGVLPTVPDDSSLHRLVVTSGDFGLAYLVERWAARFVSELFRNYVVCFVGYSINDPVLRYMMDALAADKMLGEHTPQAYAIGSFNAGTEGAKLIEWEAKGVVPILYEVSAVTRDHSLMHATLKAWADTYRDGVLGRERIVLEYALSRPSLSTQQDNFVGRMRWALAHHTGAPAKLFAEHNPAPSLDWLKALSDECYVHGDLPRFGVESIPNVGENFRFSLTWRPAPPNLSSRMSFVEGRLVGTQWDKVMHQLGCWLVRHLNDPELFFWVIERGHRLHENLCSLIEHRLEHYAQLERDGKHGEIAIIRSNSPNAIPDSFCMKLWRLFLTGRVKSAWDGHGLYRWSDRLKRDGLTTTLRLELRRLLSPQVTLKKPFRWLDDEARASLPGTTGASVNWELELASDYVYSILVDSQDKLWRSLLPDLFDDFQLLLKDALDLLTELGKIEERSDCSYWDLPSISKHWQNRRFHEWTALIELLRDSWVAMSEAQPSRASSIAKTWFGSSYPTFKRLALFAASQDGIVGTGEWVSWLLTDECWWLWTGETQRETLRLIMLQGKHLNGAVQESLEAAVLAGPPRIMYLPDLKPEEWQQILDNSRWLHLAQLRKSGLELGSNALATLVELELSNPDWKLRDHERDEFPSWMSGTGDPDYREEREINIAPRTRQALVSWLQQPVEQRRLLNGDTWRETCNERFFRSVGALQILAKRGIWPAARWRTALQTWSDERHAKNSWRFIARLVNEMPEAVLEEVAGPAAWWVESCSPNLKFEDVEFLPVCARLLNISLEKARVTNENEKREEPVNDAINHPVGHIAQAVVRVWLNGHPSDNDGLPAQISEVFTRMCDTEVKRFRHGRVILAANLIALFRVDPDWAAGNIIPLLNWGSSTDEARAVWDGFFWNPRLHFPLLIAFKEQFLACAKHYQVLAKHSRKFPKFLTYAALNGVEQYTADDFRVAIESLPQEGLNQIARTLAEALEGAGEQREDYWTNRIQPFWQSVWPKSRALGSDEIATSLARLAVAADGKFVEVLDVVYSWLRPLEHPDYVLSQLLQTTLCDRFPYKVLQLLDALIKSQQWVSSDLGQCLAELEKASSDISRDPTHRKLSEYWRIQRLSM